MKKFLIVFILALFIAIPGCKKDPVFYNITSSVTIGGTIDPLGISSVEAGSNIIYTIKPDENYNISSIKVDDIDFPVSNTIEIKNVRSNTEIKVVFTLNTFTITALAGGGVVIDPKGVFIVASGKSMTFSFNAIDDRTITSIKVNNNQANTYPNKNYVLFKDSITLNIYENTTLRVESISNDSLNIMGSWYLQQSFWMIDGKWCVSYPDAAAFTERTVYSFSSLQTFNKDNVLIGLSNWKIIGDTICFGRTGDLVWNEARIEKISKDTIIFVNDTPPQGKVLYTRFMKKNLYL